MSSKNLYEEDSSINNTSVNKKKKAKHVNNQFSMSKPSFLKKSTISSILNKFNDGFYSHRVAKDKIHTSKNSIDASLSIDRRRNKKLSKIFTNKKNAQTQMKKTITSNFYKNKNVNKENLSLNNYKVNLTMKNHINFNNTSSSFIKNISKSKSINKDSDNEKYGGKDIGTSSLSPIEITSKKNRINSYKTKNKNKESANDKEKEKLKYIFFKNKAMASNKQYIYVQKNMPIIQHENNKPNYSNNNNNNKYDFKTLKTERLSQRYKRINLNAKNKTERIIVPKNKLKNNIGNKINDNENNSKKKFTFNDLKALNELINKKGSKEKEKENNINNNININNNYNLTTNNKKEKINLSNLLKNILSDNSSYNSTNYKTKINKNLNYTKSKDSKSSNDYSNEKNNNKTQDMADDSSNNMLISPRLITVKSRKNNSVKRRSPANTKEIISKILNDNKSQDKESFDANNSFQKTARNFIHSKRESFIINKNNKKPGAYINLLIIDSNEKRKLYAQAKSQNNEKFHKSLTDRSKLIDYINFKVGSNKKQKEIKKENIINITNKPHKKENMSRNIKNSNNFTNSNSITNENNNTNYISPKQYEKEDKMIMHTTTPLIYNKMISMTLNKSLKMTSNNSNLNMTIKNNNNNNDQLIQQKLKKNKINKNIIHKKKILHDKKASMTTTSNFDYKKNGLIYDKKNALDKAFSPRLNLTSRAKDNSFLKKEISPVQINKKVIKIDSCSVPGYSAPGVSKINQDNYFIIKEFMNNTEQFFMGICDGHGSYGHLISEYICNTLPPKIKIISNENIKNAFLSTNKSLIEESKIDCSLSGSTCSSLIISQDKLISANVGDSRAVLARYENGQYNAINLTRDHKPTEPDEMKRILNNGGRIKQFTEPRTGNSIGPERIWLKNSEIPGLAMSRSLGDNLAHTVGVSAEPEIQKFEFNGSEKFILLASDGIWEFIDSDESVRIIKDFYEKDMDAVGALSALVKEAFKRWKSEEDNIDDITAILIFFE